MKNILFLCTGNSCRSQMAEGWAKHLYPDQQNYRFFSAGTEKHGLNPKAVAVMQEAGVDISSHVSKTTQELPTGLKMDYVFTVCDNAREACPVFPGGKIIHVGFPDPPYLTRDMKDEEEILQVYRSVRDEIRQFVEKLESYL